MDAKQYLPHGAEIKRLSTKQYRKIKIIKLLETLNTDQMEDTYNYIVNEVKR
jgi:hypothetical protein